MGAVAWKAGDKAIHLGLVAQGDYSRPAKVEIVDRADDAGRQWIVRVSDVYTCTAIAAELSPLFKAGDAVRVRLGDTVLTGSVSPWFMGGDGEPRLNGGQWRIRVRFDETDRDKLGGLIHAEVALSDLVLDAPEPAAPRAGSWTVGEPLILTWQGSRRRVSLAAAPYWSESESMWCVDVHPVDGGKLDHGYPLSAVERAPAVDADALRAAEQKAMRRVIGAVFTWDRTGDIDSKPPLDRAVASLRAARKARRAAGLAPSKAERIDLRIRLNRSEIALDETRRDLTTARRALEAVTRQLATARKALGEAP